MPMSPDTAHGIASSLLDATGRALVSGDFDGFIRCFRLPQTIAAIDNVQHLNTKADARRVFDKIRAHYSDVGLSRLERRIELALFDGPEVIQSCHVARLLAEDGTDAKPQVETLSRLVCEEGQWLIARTQAIVPGASALGQALMMGAPSAPKRPDAGPAEALFQAHLDRVTASYMDNDLEILCQSVQLPLFVQTSKGAVVMSTPDDLKEDFNRMVTSLRVRGVTDIVRRVHFAEMVGDQRIHGAYRTHILSGAQMVIPAYKSAMTLEQGQDLRWRMTSVIHPMGHLTTTAKQTPQGPGGVA